MTSSQKYKECWTSWQPLIHNAAHLVQMCGIYLKTGLKIHPHEKCQWINASCSNQFASFPAPRSQPHKTSAHLVVLSSSSWDLCKNVICLAWLKSLAFIEKFTPAKQKFHRSLSFSNYIFKWCLNVNVALSHTQHWKFLATSKIPPSQHGKY